MELDIRTIEAISQPDIEQEREWARKREAQKRAIDEMIQRHADSVKTLQVKALERIGSIDAKDLTPADALKWLEVGVKLERLNHKLPNRYNTPG